MLGFLDPVVDFTWIFLYFVKIHYGVDNYFRIVYHSNVGLNVFMTTKTKKSKVELLAQKLRVAGDSNRIKILCFIFSDKKACVSDIAKHLRMSIAITSHHLQSLVKEGLLEKDREGKNICYFLAESDIAHDLKKFICRYK